MAFNAPKQYPNSGTSGFKAPITTASGIADHFATQAPINSLEAVKQSAGGQLVNALTSSEQGLAKDIASTKTIFTSQQQQDSADNVTKLVKHALTITNPVRRAELLRIAADISHTSSGQAQEQSDNIPSNAKALGDVAGTTMDILAAGSYNKAGAETGKLLVQGGKSAAVADTLAKVGIGSTQKVVAPVAENVVKQTLGQTLKGIGVKTAQRAAESGALGYGFDVSQNLQSGKTGGDAFKPGLGTALGVGIPAVIGSLQAGAAITKATAPRLINSLIKPLSKDFAYGKNPGATISEMGITGNNFNEFADNVQTARKDVGQQIGTIASDLEGKTNIDLTPSLQPIDNALTEARKSPRTNSALITRLENVKQDLLGIPVDSIPGEIPQGTRQLNGLSVQQGIDFKGMIGDLTKWTGNASDDKAVNKALKQVYGIANKQVMSGVESVSPEIAKKMASLNDKYGNLLSAENAIKHTDALAQRQNLISMPLKVGGVAGLITAVATGGASIPAILAGVGVGTLDKALASTAFKTRIAAWLADESPSVTQKLPPEVKTVLYRALPKFASQLGQ